MSDPYVADEIEDIGNIRLSRDKGQPFFAYLYVPSLNLWAFLCQLNDHIADRLIDLRDHIAEFDYYAEGRDRHIENKAEK